MNYLRKVLMLSCVLTCASTAFAQADVLQEETESQAPKKWFVTAQLGGTLAFGDDSWNVFKDFGPASAMCASLSVGYEFSPVISARLRGRIMRLHNRVNLEVYDAYHWDYPDLFPNKGFYGYSAYAVQAEAMFNVTNIIPRKSNFFNIYLLGGVGFNSMGVYDSVVNEWDGSYENAPGMVYHVDTKTHTMPLGMIGGMLDFRISKNTSLNIEAACTFTGDEMEGVKYEESYDAYITYSAGLTIYF